MELSIMIIRFAMAVALSAGILFILGVLLPAESVKNGRELALKFHKARGNDIYDVEARWLFLFPFLPLTRQRKQVLPWIEARFRGAYLLCSTLTWCALGEFSARKQWFKLFFSSFAGVLVSISAVGVAYGFVMNEWFVMSQWILIALALAFFKQIFIINTSLDALKVMDISNRDKKLLKVFVILTFIIYLVALIAEVIKFVIRMQSRD